MPDSVASTVLGHGDTEATAVPSCAVLVMSCDAYRDLWRPFFTLFWRYWPDCPFPVYLGATYAKYDDQRVTTLAAGDETWGNAFRRCLERIDAEYVLLLLEDYFLKDPISTPALLRALTTVDALEGAVLRLYPSPGPDVELPGQDEIGLICLDAPYRVSMQPAIWSRAALLHITRDEESIWEFEWKGTRRSRAIDKGFFATFEPVLRYRHVVERGRWFRSAAKHYRREQIGCDFAARSVIGPVQTVWKAINRRRRNFSDSVSKFVSRRRVANPGLPLRVSGAIRIAFLTNLIAPYWKCVFDTLALRCPNLRIFLSTQMEPNRQWGVDWRGLDVVLQRTITFYRGWRHPKGFTEPVYVHLPLDTVSQLRKFRPDVVISNEMGLRTALAALYRKLHSNSRLIVWADMAQSTEQGRGHARVWLRRRLPGYADAFVVLGESGARYVRSLGVSDEKIWRVPYATEVSRFAACPLRRRDEQARRLLYSGQLIERKGLLPFVRALSRWAQANPECEIELSLAGDGPLREVLASERVAPNLKLSLLGDIAYPELPSIYANAGIFVFPTLADSWGVVVNEALASGLPVLGSVYSQAVEELVQDGRNGWIFRPDDENTLYQAIGGSLKTPLDALHKMREKARSAALELTPESTANRIEAIVTSVRKVC